MRKKVWLIILIIIFILLALFYFLFYKKGNDTYETIELYSDVIRIKVDEIKLMPYKISITNERQLVFKSYDDSIARVDKQGYIYGVKIGETFVTVGYQENESYLKKVKVIVQEDIIDGEGQEKDIGGDDPETTVKPNDDKGNNQNNPNNNNNDNNKVAKATCSLKVQSDGTITASNKNATQYSFDRNFINNEIEKNIKDIENKEVKDYEGWKYFKVNYYVLNSNNERGTCSIIVIEKCNRENVCTYENY